MSHENAGAPSRSVVAARRPADVDCADGRCEDPSEEASGADLAALLQSLLAVSTPSDPDYLSRFQPGLRDKRVRTHAAGFARAWVSDAQ